MSKIDEYKEAASQHRLQNSLIFGQLAVFLIATGTLAKILPSQESTNSMVAVLPVVGIVLAISFFIITSRAAYFSHISVKRAIELEGDLGYKLFSNYAGNNKTVFTATNAVKAVYISVAIAWAWVAWF